MSDKLTFELAIGFAERLTTIGHPYGKGAILATAEDLMEWCTGVILPGGTRLTAEGQAAKLIREARVSWSDGWPDKGGTAKLHELFRKLFAPKVKPGNGFTDYDNEPCICGEPKKFKDCCKPKNSGIQ
jgi:uncharacterized protein YchJ